MSCQLWLSETGADPLQEQYVRWTTDVFLQYLDEQSQPFLLCYLQFCLQKPKYDIELNEAERLYLSESQTPRGQNDFLQEKSEKTDFMLSNTEGSLTLAYTL